MAKVYVSASMQEHNAYATGGTEEQYMNKIVDVVIPELARHNVTSFRNNPAWDLATMVKDSNSKNVDLHVAVHSNAGGGKGTEVFYKPTSAQSKRIAQFLYDNVSALTPEKDRGIKPTFVLYEIRKPKAVAALIEVEYHDNKEGADFIKSHIGALGIAIAKAILSYFGIAYKPKTAAPQNTSKNAIELEVITNVLNCRTGPGLQYSVLKQYKEGDSLTAIGITAGWYKLDVKGTPGYILGSGKYVKTK